MVNRRGSRARARGRAGGYVWARARARAARGARGARVACGAFARAARAARMLAMGRTHVACGVWRMRARRLGGRLARARACAPASRGTGGTHASGRSSRAPPPRLMQKGHPRRACAGVIGSSVSPILNIAPPFGMAHFGRSRAKFRRTLADFLSDSGQSRPISVGKV